MSVPLQDESAAFRYAEFIERARRKDREAFAELYERTYRRVFGYLLAHSGDRGTAEELLQEVYLAALQSVASFRGKTEGELVGWLLKICRGKVADRLRSKYRRPEIAGGDAIAADAGIDPMETIDRRIELAEIADALSQLTEEQREVIVRRFVLEMDLDETGRQMRKNTGSVKALQHRGLATLARILRKRGETDAQA